MDVLIKNGNIVDGTRSKAFVGDVLVRDGVVQGIGEGLEADGIKVVDAKNRLITPGFIDTHSHSDLVMLVNPYNEVKIRQGITTEVLGQDGISMAPLPIEHISSWRKNLAGLDGDSDEIDWKYETTENYLNMMADQGVGLNETYLVPHGNVRMEAMGLVGEVASDEQIKKMCDVLRREMEAGAYGLSTGLIYIPCAYSETKEVVELCKVVAEFDGVFVVHQRSEADTILDSMKEIIQIGKESGVKVHFSHFKVCGKQNWKYIDGVIELLEQAQEEGIRVSFDQYPYAAGSTMLGVILPPWAHDGGTDNLIERLNDEDARRRMKEDIANGIPGWDNFVDFAGIDQIFVTSVKSEENQEVVGMSLEELGKFRGMDPLDATFDLLRDEENAVGMVDFYGKEEHIIKFMQRPEHNVCTDGLMAKGKPHPRAYGSFPKILSRFVKEKQVFDIETAIHKMTKKAADAIGIKDRGTIEVGRPADILIIDMETVKDNATFIEPVQFSDGIDHVFINGHHVIEEGSYNKILAGEVIKRR